MRYPNNLTLIIAVAAVAAISATSLSFAAEQNPAVAAEAGEPNAISLPYIAAMTEDNVNIRSGPGTNFYSCGKLNIADKVEVVGTQFSWLQIVPPPTCFAWISKQYVTTDPNNPGVGTVTGDSVRVYAGSESLKPIHSTTIFVKLNTGDKVAILDQTEADYYKIAPPDGSYLWISSNYVKPLGPASSTTRPAPTPVQVMVPTTISGEAIKIEEYYALEKQLKAEKQKPLDEQNYETLKKAFVEIAGNKEAGKAARFSEFAIKQIEKCELAKLVAKEAAMQDSQLEQVKQKIEKARAEKLAQFKDLGRYAVIGELQVSNIYGTEQQTRRYRLIDSAGKAICYAAPVGPALEIDMTPFIGRQVGLVGTIEPLPHISGVLVKFTEVGELD